MTPSPTVAYDANGNTLSDASGKSYTWDFDNRLTQAIVPGTGTTIFRYDPFGRRILKSGPLGTTNYLYDGENVIGELDNSGNILARYTHEPRWDGPLSMLRGGVTSYYHQDGLNSVESLSNSAGALAQSYTYDSFGKISASTGTLTNPFQYTAREFDPETGIFHYRARYYDQTIGRFLSEDPKILADKASGYPYVRNSPASLVDPTGEFWAWGWWCGPNWTGGRVEEYDPAHASMYHKPWGDTDTACMHHDICYYECRKGHPCNKEDRSKCMRNCDDVLLTEAPYSLVGNFISTTVWAYNNKPDTGENARSCPCSQASSFSNATLPPGVDLTLLIRFGSR